MWGCDRKRDQKDEDEQKFFFSPGQFACGSATDPTRGPGDDSDATGMYDGMMFAVDRGDEGFDAEGGRRGAQR